MDMPFAIAVALLLAGSTSGSGPYPPPKVPDSAEAGSASLQPLPDAPLVEVSPGLFQIGLVELDRNKRTVSFPGAVNMDSGEVEYVVVSAIGKLHESVFRTEAEPLHIHLAALFLQPPRGDAAPAEPPGDPTLAGEKVTLSASWQSADGEKRHRLEEFVLNTKTKAAMTTGEWIYNGSLLFNGAFLAQRDGSIVSIIIDPYALMNNPRPGREIDYIWNARSELTPPVNTPVQITVQFPNVTP
jgi:hypothetical protein